MKGTLERLSDTRWKYTTARSVFYVKELSPRSFQVSCPDGHIGIAEGYDPEVILDYCDHEAAKTGYAVPWREYIPQWSNP